MTDHIPYDFFDFSDNPPLAALQIPFDWNSDELSLTFFLYFVGNDQVLTLSSDWNRYDSYSPNSSSSDSSTSSLSYDEYFSNFLQHPAATPLDFASISPLLLSNSLQLDNVPEIKSNAFVYHLPSYDQEDEMTYDSGVPLFKAPISFEHLIPGYAQTMSIDAITFELDQASHEIESEDESNEENLAEDDLIKFSIAYSTSADRVLDVSSMAAFGPVVLKREIVDQAGKSVDIEFSVNSDSFLHSSPTTLLAYRRNYFVLRFNLTTPALTPSGLYLSSDQPISRFIARIQAHSDMPLDDNSSEKKIIEIARFSLSRRAGPAQQSFDLVIPSPAFSATTNTTATAILDRLQFMSSSLKTRSLSTSFTSHIKKKGIDEHFIITAKIYAVMSNGEEVEIGLTESKPIVVRGRSPGHFATKEYRHYGVIGDSNSRRVTRGMLKAGLA